MLRGKACDVGSAVTGITDEDSTLRREGRNLHLHLISIRMVGRFECVKCTCQNVHKILYCTKQESAKFITDPFKNISS